MRKSKEAFAYVLVALYATGLFLASAILHNTGVANAFYVVTAILSVYWAYSAEADQ